MATARAKPKRATEPDQGSSHSGRLLLRMPPSLHAELAEAADREGQSLNAYITGVLADRNGDAQPPEPRAPSRVLRTAVIIDLALVAIAAIVAIALLVVAWP